MNAFYEQVHPFFCYKLKTYTEPPLSRRRRPYGIDRTAYSLKRRVAAWPHETAPLFCTPLPPYNSVNGSTSITSAVAPHLLSRANDCARRNSSLSAVRLAALMRN